MPETGATGAASAESRPAPAVNLANQTPAGAPLDLSVFVAKLSPYGRWVLQGGYGWMWLPGGMPAGWQPYTVGHWQVSDAGWLWVSDEPFGWATYHYGRWLYDEEHGWAWLPGDRWGAAWVAWRAGDGYVGWAPLSPDDDDDAPYDGGGEELPAAHFCFVKEGALLAPQVVQSLEPVAADVIIFAQTAPVGVRRRPAPLPADSGAPAQVTPAGPVVAVDVSVTAPGGPPSDAGNPPPGGSGSGGPGGGGSGGPGAGGAPQPATVLSFGPPESVRPGGARPAGGRTVSLFARPKPGEAFGWVALTPTRGSEVRPTTRVMPNPPAFGPPGSASATGGMSPMVPAPGRSIATGIAGTLLPPPVRLSSTAQQVEERQHALQSQAEAQRQQQEQQRQAEAQRQELAQAELQRQTEMQAEEQRRAEARRQQEEQRRQAQEQAEQQRQAEMQAEQQRQAEAQRQQEAQQRQTQAQAEQQRQAEAQRQELAQAEQQRQTEMQAEQQRQAEAQRQQEERQRQAQQQAEQQRQAQMQAEQQRQAEAQRQQEEQRRQAEQARQQQEAQERAQHPPP